MVKIGQNADVKKTNDITNVGFNPPRDARLSVELMSMDELRKRAPAEHFEKFQRADFFRLIGVLDGHTTPMVDFSNFAAQAGSWLLVRPGQVFRYDFSSAWSGWLLVFRPDCLTAVSRGGADEMDLLGRVEDLRCLNTLPVDQHQCMTRTLQQMQYDDSLTEDAALRNELLRHSLVSTLLRLSLWQTDGSVGNAHQGAGRANFRRFRELLETDFAAQHQVQHYATALGMSEKTLSRVCAAAIGSPAKAAINQRLVLEAKRLLAHTGIAVQTIGRELGFDEASNFVKFFRKETGLTPLAFRQKNSHSQVAI